jgi:hypothetical protein
MRTSPILRAAGAALIVSSSAQAATVTVERGEVLINRGKGFTSVSQPTEAAPGDQVMAKPRGSGRIAFADGCTVTVAPGTVLTIAPKSPCERTGSHSETGGSLKDAPLHEEPAAAANRDDLLFLAVVGVAAGFVLLPTKDKAASP